MFSPTEPAYCAASVAHSSVLRYRASRIIRTISRLTSDGGVVASIASTAAASLFGWRRMAYSPRAVRRLWCDSHSGLQCFSSHRSSGWFFNLRTWCTCSVGDVRPSSSQSAHKGCLSMNHLRKRCHRAERISLRCSSSLRSRSYAASVDCRPSCPCVGGRVGTRSQSPGLPGAGTCLCPWS